MEIRRKMITFMGFCFGFPYYLLTISMVALLALTSFVVEEKQSGLTQGLQSFSMKFNSEGEDSKPNNLRIFLERPSIYDKIYSTFPESLRLEMLNKTHRMFTFGYDNYIKFAFPKDELNPIYCTGRGPDVGNPSNININDVLGNYSLTLVDSLDTLAVMGNTSEFRNAVKMVIDKVSFDKDVTVQVFEANIRLLGGLISAHLLMSDPHKTFGDLRPSFYNTQLLDLATDLAIRLLPAFENSITGLPYPRVNLKYGVPNSTDCHWCLSHTCTAGAGSLLLEFGMLSRLTGNPVFDEVARRSSKILWLNRANQTGLLGNIIDVETGEWVEKMSGIGAGIDSFYEYLLKSYILFGETEDFKMFRESYNLIKRYLRKGRAKCNEGRGYHPVYVNVNMLDGSTLNLWIDSLQAAFAGVQVLHGDIEEAICAHALYYVIWKRYGALPERFNWQKITPELSFYPLRPELIESTYLLYQATRNPFYLHVGKEISDSIEKYTKVECGYATIHDVHDKSLEDRMESFFLSETCKYLYLLFDFENPFNKNPTRFIFTTEGHLFPISWKYGQTYGDDHESSFEKRRKPYKDNLSLNIRKSLAFNLYKTNLDTSCSRIHEERHYLLPLQNDYFHQIVQALGLQSSMS